MMIGSILRVTTPFLLAAVGGLFSELAGVLNIALEGLMLVGAFTSVAVTATTGSIPTGVVAGMLAPAVVAWLYGQTALRLRANIFVAGIGTNLLASGLTVVLSARLFGHKGVVRFADYPSVARVSDLVPSLRGTAVDLELLIAMSWVTLWLAWLVLYRTPLGLRMRSVGRDPLVASAAGLNARAYKVGALVLSGMFCGLAGTTLSLGLGAIVPGVTAGRGWIALVIVYLGRRRIRGIIAASLLFGVAEVLSNTSQGVFSLPTELVLAFPYMVSLIALIVASAMDTARKRDTQGFIERVSPSAATGQRKS